ncbi:aspartate kinase [Actinomycetospora rhizophila]|uniref:Aspartokinase n=1 Tax=Actinomycetospora rhizophila TaxID=1416876 RepID=A0ABV9ZIL1_9PSEU
MEHAMPDLLRPPTPPATVVWKFGGTSVADHERLRAVAERMVAAHHDGLRVVAVLSAMGRSTDELCARAYTMSSQPSLRELDALLSVGEAISCALAAMAIHELGCRAVSLNAAQIGIVTDGAHSNARLRHVPTHRITAELDDGAIVLVTGFQGVSETGDVTTLGRGGSDASAVAVAAALGLDRCDIYTDVPGVFTADPRLVPDARPLESVGHEEMLELAEGGAGVLQPRAVELAAAQGVDVHLRSSFTHESGTWIRRELPRLESLDVVGLAHRHQERLYAVPDVSPSHVASVLAARGASVGALVRQGSEVRFTAPGTDPAEIDAAFGAADGGVRVHDDLGTVSVVSTGIARKPEITCRALRALEGAGIEAFLLTVTPGRVSVHVDAARVPHAVRLLHDTFLGPAVPAPVADVVPIPVPALDPVDADGAHPRGESVR